MWNNPIGRVRGVGMIEGTSFLVLLLVAMPLKYIAKLPEGEAIVFWVGLVHGVLFISYACVAFHANAKGYLPKKLLGYAALASVLPFGPFVIDRKLKEAEKPQADTAATGELREDTGRV